MGLAGTGAKRGGEVRLFLFTTLLDPISGLGEPRSMSTMSSAEIPLIVLNPVANDTTSTVEAGRCERLNCAFKTIEGVGVASLYDIKGLVVSIVAISTCPHRVELLAN
jgi:hypothetical protein